MDIVPRVSELCRIWNRNLTILKKVCLSKWVKRKKKVTWNTCFRTNWWCLHLQFSSKFAKQWHAIINLSSIKNGTISQTLIMTVCWPGSSLSAGSCKHPDILLSLLIGVPSHLTSGLPTAGAGFLPAFPFSECSVVFRRLIGNPGADIPPKKSVILFFCFTNPSELPASVSCLSSKAFDSGLFWGRSWGVSGWVSESESDRSGLRRRFVAQASIPSVLSWVWDASVLTVVLEGLTNHCSRVFRTCFCGGMVLWSEPFLLTPRKTSSPVFGRMSIFVSALLSLLSRVPISYPAFWIHKYWAVGQNTNTKVVIKQIHRLTHYEQMVVRRLTFMKRSWGSGVTCFSREFFSERL